MSETKKKTTVKKMRDVNKSAYVFLIPFVVVFCIFSIYPVVRTLQLSFTNYKGFGNFDYVGFDNYIRVFGDQYFWRALGTTFRIWLVNIVLQLGIAFLLTIVFSDIKYKIRGLSVFRAVYYLPGIIAATSIALLFKFLLDWRFGTANQILNYTGLDKVLAFILRMDAPINWLGDVRTAPLVISLIQTWIWFGNSFIMLMAGVQGINSDYFEAAAIDGAGRWRRFFSITLPLLRPIMLYVFITSLIGGVQMFDLPFLLSNVNGDPLGSTQTAIMYLYKFGFATRPKQVGYAAAIAYVLFFLILILSIIQFLLLNKKEED